MQIARIFIIAYLLSVHALAGSSTDYSLEPAVLDGGGAAGSSSSYALNPSIGSGAAGASADFAVRSGFSGILRDASSLVLAAAGAAGSMNERATLQLEARIRRRQLTRLSGPWHLALLVVHGGAESARDIDAEVALDPGALAEQQCRGLATVDSDLDHHARPEHAA